MNVKKKTLVLGWLAPISAEKNQPVGMGFVWPKKNAGLKTGLDRGTSDWKKILRTEKGKIFGVL